MALSASGAGTPISIHAGSLIASYSLVIALLLIRAQWALNREEGATWDVPVYYGPATRDSPNFLTRNSHRREISFFFFLSSHHFNIYLNLLEFIFGKRSSVLLAERMISLTGRLSEGAGPLPLGEECI